MDKVILLLNLGTSFDGVLRIATIGAKVILSTMFLFPFGKRETEMGSGIGQGNGRPGGVDWSARIGRSGADDAICLALLVGVRKVILRLAFLPTRLLIEHLVEIDRLVNQGLDFRLASRNDDCFFYLVVKSTIKHDALRLVIDTEGYREALEGLSVRSCRACLDEAIESILTFQFIGTVAVDIGESSHECGVIFAKRVPFVGDDLACP